MPTLLATAALCLALYLLTRHAHLLARVEALERAAEASVGQIPGNAESLAPSTPRATSPPPGPGDQATATGPNPATRAESPTLHGVATEPAAAAGAAMEPEPVFEPESKSESGQEPVSDPDPDPDSDSEPERVPESEQEPDPVAPLSHAPAPAAPAADWERTLGLRALAWAGVGILFLSLIFFCTYAYRQGWLGAFLTPPVRLGGIAAVGAGLLLAGYRALRSGMRPLGGSLTGGGLASWYLAIYAALDPTLMVVPAPLLAPLGAGCLLALTVVGGLLLALRWNMQAIAVGALLGGLATPVLLGGAAGSPHLLFGYLLLLDLGVLITAWRRRWRFLESLAFLGTVALFALHYGDGRGITISTTLPWLLALGTVFLVLPFPLHWRTRTRVPGESFAGAIAAVAFVAGYAAHLLGPTAPVALGAIHLALAGGLLILRATTLQRCGRDARVEEGFAVVATALLALAALAALPADAVVTAWLIEAVALLVLGYRFACRGVRAVAPILVLAAAVRSLATGAWPIAAAFLAHPTVGEQLGVVAALLACALVHRAAADRADRGDRAAMHVLGILAGAWLIPMLSADWLRAGWNLRNGGGVWSGQGFHIGSLAWWPALVAGGYAACARRWSWRPGAGAALTAALAATALAALAMPVVEPSVPILHPAALGGLAALVAAWVARPRPGAGTAITTIVAGAGLLGLDCALALHDPDTPSALRGTWMALPWLVAAVVLARRPAAQPGERRACNAAAGAAWLLGTVAALMAYTAPHAAVLPFLNLRAAGAALAIAAALAVGQRPASLAAGVLGFVAITLEAVVGGWYAEATDTAISARVTAVWLGYAVLLLTLGFWRRRRSARIAALTLFAVTAGKLVLIDLAQAHTLVRIGSFLGTGMTLIAASWLYHRLESRLRNGTEAPDDADRPQAAPGSADPTDTRGEPPPTAQER